MWPGLRRLSYKQRYPGPPCEHDPRHLHRLLAEARELEEHLAFWQVGKDPLWLDFRAICKDMQELRRTFWLRDQHVQKQGAWKVRHVFTG